MSEKVRPCPFCGEKIQMCVANRYYFASSFASSFVRCGNCYCRGPMEPTEQRAIQAWNHRYTKRLARREELDKAHKSLFKDDL